jgi:uncharacterized membrane protein YfcA
MELIVICLVAFITAILTFFSGFGLGTILMPVFAIFFPIEIAIAITGVVHFSNNLFKISLVGKKADKEVLFDCISLRGRNNLKLCDHEKNSRHCF